MCTVSFLPLPHGGYLLGTNRDESPLRGAAQPPSVQCLADRKLLMPRDSDAGGTWVTVDDRGRCLCILNGDAPALPVPSEAPSRGLLLLELAECSTPAAMLAELQQRHASGELAQKAFKLLVAEPGAAGGPATASLIEWNGRDAPSWRVLYGCFVLVSSSFDPDGVAARRERAFSGLAAVPTDDTDALVVAQSRWHATHSQDAPSGDTYTVCMHRKEASTVSFTAVRVDRERVQMAYRAGAPCLGGELTRLSMDVS